MTILNNLLPYVYVKCVKKSLFINLVFVNIKKIIFFAISISSHLLMGSHFYIMPILHSFLHVYILNHNENFIKH